MMERNLRDGGCPPLCLQFTVWPENQLILQAQHSAGVEPASSYLTLCLPAAHSRGPQQRCPALECLVQDERHSDQLAFSSARRRAEGLGGAGGSGYRTQVIRVDSR